jgi:sigma-B regulation protein RsbU (phosphoserine phosphatase)
MAKVDAEAGSVLLTRASGRELEFVVVRGPKAKQLIALFALRGAVPVSDGVVGYCVREGVALAVSDARKDRRHLWDVSVAIDYETRSILCAPIARRGHVLGALEVLNKRGGAPFDAQDLAVLSELAREAAEHLARCGG